MKKLFVAGHNGMVGSSICRNNTEYELIKVEKNILDLRYQQFVDAFFQMMKPDIVVISAAKVGGIHANSAYPAEFLYDNIMIASNLIHSSYKNNVEKVLFLGSSCVYPKYSKQPIKEEYLLTSELEPTNEAYAIAKIAGIKLCEFYNKQYNVDYHSIMPCNLYGIGDNYHPENSHVLPGLIRRFHEAKIKNLKEVVVWGSGTPLREFLFADDLAKIILNILKLKGLSNLINVGSDYEFSIKELAYMVKDVVEYNGNLIFDSNKPDGTPRKKMDNTLLKKYINVEYTDFIEGLKVCYNDFLSRYER